MKKATLFIIAAPSGGGKTSLVNALIKEIPQLQVSVSYTTRPKRPDEEHGVNYFFISEEQFNEKVKQHSFLEYATVFGYHYGTSKHQVEQSLSQGFDVILEIDWQGARQICRMYPDAKTIFILPPSLQDLEQRLRARGQDDEHTVQQRMAEAKNEISHYAEFEYIIINKTFEVALSDLSHIILSQRLTYRCQKNLLLETYG